MPGFANIAELANAYDEGRVKYSTWRKTPAQATVSGIWTDLSMAPGNPVPNYYASSPLVAATLNGNEGIFHGGNVSPMTKHVARLTSMSTTAAANPLPKIMQDYLLYYPFVDQSSTDEQLMDNTVTLPRYADGTGVKIMAVLVAAQSGGATFTVNYTNQDGVAGRVTPVQVCNTATSSGTLVTSAPNTAGTSGPYLALQSGDTGVRSIEGVTFIVPDVGLICLVLVKPLCTTAMRGIDAPAEHNFWIDGPVLPQVVDGAYLNFIAHPTGSLAAAPIHGDATFVWG